MPLGEGSQFSKTGVTSIEGKSTEAAGVTTMAAVGDAVSPSYGGSMLPEVSLSVSSSPLNPQRPSIYPQQYHGSPYMYPHSMPYPYPPYSNMSYYASRNPPLPPYPGVSSHDMASFSPVLPSGDMSQHYGRFGRPPFSPPAYGAHPYAPMYPLSPVGSLPGQPINLSGKRSHDEVSSDSRKSKKLKSTSANKKKSKFRGVFWHSRGKAWVSSIMVNGKTTHLGYYDDEVEAARVYDKEAIRLKGITCAVNFPDSVERFGNNSEASTATGNSRSTRHERKRAERISKYRGVCWNKCNSSWKACIKIDGKNKHIGYFSDEKDAAEAYDAKAREVRGASAKLNFPKSD